MSKEMRNSDEVEEGGSPISFNEDDVEEMSVRSDSTEGTSNRRYNNQPDPASPSVVVVSDMEGQSSDRSTLSEQTGLASEDTGSTAQTGQVSEQTDIVTNRTRAEISKAPAAAMVGDVQQGSVPDVTNQTAFPAMGADDLAPVGAPGGMVPFSNSRQDETSENSYSNYSLSENTENTVGADTLESQSSVEGTVESTGTMDPPLQTSYNPSDETVGGSTPGGTTLGSRDNIDEGSSHTGGDTNVSQGWSRFDEDNSLGEEASDTFFERALPPSTTNAGVADPPAYPAPSLQGSCADESSMGESQGGSNESAGWSRYDDDFNTTRSKDTNVEFFERALPPSQQSKDAGFRDPPAVHAAVGSSTIESDTFRSNQSRGWSRYDEETALPTSINPSFADNISAFTDEVSKLPKLPRETTTPRETPISSSRRAVSANLTPMRSNSNASSSVTQLSSRSEGSANTTGILYRQAPNKLASVAREVEVSMDGFMHQTKSTRDDTKSVATTAYSSFIGPGDSFYNEDPVTGKKKLSIKQVCTALPILLLVATSLFTASQIGPFYVIPDRRGQQSASDLNNDERESVIGQDQGIVDEDSNSIPKNLQAAFVNWRIEYNEAKRQDLPIIWNYDFSGGSIASHIFGYCLGRTQAGIRFELDPNSRFNEEFEAMGLKVIKSDKQLFGDNDMGSQLFVNVDLGTSNGIFRALQLGLPTSHVAQSASTPHLHAVTNLFQARSGRVTPDVQGRLMVLFRDPIERSLKRYEMIKMTVTDLSLVDYSKNPNYTENNPLVRKLTGMGPDKPLGEDQFKMAQSIISQKVLVGLYDDFQTSMEVWEKFFGWYVGDTILPIYECHKTLEDFLKPNVFEVSQEYALSEPKAYNFILAQHRMDRRLYDYAKTLFYIQQEEVEKLYITRQNAAASMNRI